MFLEEQYAIQQCTCTIGQSSATTNELDSTKWLLNNKISETNI